MTALRFAALVTFGLLLAAVDLLTGRSLRDEGAHEPWPH